MHCKGLFTVLENADKATKIINISITKIEVTNSIFDQFMRSLWRRASYLFSIAFNHTMLPVMEGTSITIKATGEFMFSFANTRPLLQSDQ